MHLVKNHSLLIWLRSFCVFRVFSLVELWCLTNFFNTKIQRSKVHFPCPNASHETLLLPAAVAAMPVVNVVREKVTDSGF